MEQSFKVKLQETHLRVFFFKNDFMFPRNIALKKADNSNTMRQAQLIWSENEKAIREDKGEYCNRGISITGNTASFEPDGSTTKCNLTCKPHLTCSIA